MWIEAEQSLRLFGIAAGGGLPVDQAGRSVQFADGVDVGDELVARRKRAGELDLQVAPGSADVDPVAKTPTNFSDFVYWRFTGFVPGMGEGGGEDETGEPARWRSGTFIAVSGVATGNIKKAEFLISFKARMGQVDKQTGAYVNPVDGIYLRQGSDLSPLLTVVETGMDGSMVDPNAPTGLSITDMGVECYGFRDRWLVINVKMGTEEAGWAGIYMTEVSNALFK